MSILNVGDFVGTGVVFNMLKDTDTTDVVSAGSEDEGAVIEFDDSVDLTSLKVELDRVVLLDIWMRETDGPAVVGHNVWNLVLAKDLSLDLAELESSLLSVNLVSLEATLNVVKNAEVFVSLLDGNDVLETSGNRGSLLILLSILILASLCLQILRHSWPERAYLSLLRRSTESGMHSRSLWGPVEGRVA